MFCTENYISTKKFRDSHGNMRDNVIEPLSKSSLSKSSFMIYIALNINPIIP
jgi:hypothetical protein